MPLEQLPETCQRCERPLMVAGSTVSKLEWYSRRRVLSGAKAGQPSWSGLLRTYLCNDCGRELDSVLTDNGFQAGLQQQAVANKYRELSGGRQ